MREQNYPQWPKAHTHSQKDIDGVRNHTIVVNPATEDFNLSEKGINFASPGDDNHNIHYSGSIDGLRYRGYVAHSFLIPSADDFEALFLDADGAQSPWFVGGNVPRFARVVTSDVTRTAQTLADITGLSIALDALTLYEFEAVMECAVSAVTTGNQYGVQFSAAGASVEAGIRGPLTTAADKSERINALNTATGAYLTTSGQAGQVVIKGVITVGANAGNLTIQHLKVTSGTSTVRINSFLKATKIAEA